MDSRIIEQRNMVPEYEQNAVNYEIQYCTMEKFERNFRRGDASKLNKKNGESQNSNSVSTSLHRPATRKIENF